MQESKKNPNRTEPWQSQNPNRTRTSCPRT